MKQVEVQSSGPQWDLTFHQHPSLFSCHEDPCKIPLVDGEITLQSPKGKVTYSFLYSFINVFILSAASCGIFITQQVLGVSSVSGIG